MQYARTGKLQILFLHHIPETQKRLSRRIPLNSQSRLVALVEVDRTQSGPEVLIAEVVFELGVEEHVLVLAQFHVFFNVALAVHLRLEVQGFIRERQLQLVQLLDVVFIVRLVQVEGCFVVYDRAGGRH